MTDSTHTSTSPTAVVPAATHNQSAAAGPGAPTGSVGNKPQVDPELAPFLRAENEDDDGYDPYSDRPPTREPLFEADPWA